jgi:hypothetical protein
MDVVRAAHGRHGRVCKYSPRRGLCRVPCARPEVAGRADNVHAGIETSRCAEVSDDRLARSGGLLATCGIARRIERRGEVGILANDRQDPARRRDAMAIASGGPGHPQLTLGILRPARAAQRHGESEMGGRHAGGIPQLPGDGEGLRCDACRLLDAAGRCQSPRVRGKDANSVGRRR